MCHLLFQRGRDMTKSGQLNISESCEMSDDSVCQRQVNFGMKIYHRLKELCNNTSMHGLKYIVDHERTIIERLVWMIFFCIGLSAAAYFCWLMWQKWDDSPILISFDSNNYPLKKVPFPAVTICSVNKASRRALLDILSGTRFANVSYEMMERSLRYLTKLDRAINNQKNLNELEHFFRSNDISMVDLVKILQQTAPTCDDMVLDCTWQGLPQSCAPYFSSRPTDDGICCTFNGDRYHDTELGFDTKRQPYDDLFVNGNGYRGGLSIVLDGEVEDYGVTNNKFEGFKILLHAGDEFPDVGDRGFVIGPGFEIYAGIRGVSTYSTDDVYSRTSISKRGCSSKSEETLEYFETYSQPACYVECMTKTMLSQCGCRPYFFRAFDNAGLCTLKDLTCIADVYDNVRHHGDRLCNCPNTCSQIWYNPEISYAAFPGRGFYSTRTFQRIRSRKNVSASDHQYFKENVAILHVYYKERTGDRYKIDIRFGVEDFISAMGGLLGLGIGFSFISAIEIFYFICFGWCLSRKKNNKEQSPIPLETEKNQRISNTDVSSVSSALPDDRYSSNKYLM